MDVAGLSLGAFSGIIDLFNTCAKAINAWRDLKELDGSLAIVKTRLIVQVETLQHWKRDWYSFAITGKGSVQRLQLLKSHEETIQSTLDGIQIAMKRLEPLRRAASEESKLATAEKVHWVAGEMKHAEKALADVDLLLDGLYRLLPPSIPNFEAVQTVLLLEGSEVDQETKADPSQLGLPGSASVSQTIGLRRLEGLLSNDLQNRVKKHQVKLPSEDLQMKASRIEQKKPDDTSTGTRSFAFLDEHHPVIIEWKRYDPSWQGQSSIKLKGRLDNIARLLHEDSKPPGLLTLKCLGYFDLPKETRFGFVFSYPQACDQIVSLKGLVESPSIDTLPSLEDRFNAAHALGLSLAILLTANWLHKSIRSHNILFGKLGERVVWSRPYLTGFEYSRPDKEEEVSEKPEESAQFNIYRHLRAQGPPAESFAKAYDIYSFGIVLLEIGMWRSAEKLRKDKRGRKEIHELLMKTATERLAHFMGDEYRGVTLKCLSGELENRDHTIVKAFCIEVVEVLARLSSFALN